MSQDSVYLPWYTLAAKFDSKVGFPTLIQKPVFKTAKVFKKSKET